MKLQYYPETDSLYIDLSRRPGTDSREVAEGVVLDFDENGDVVVSTLTARPSALIFRPWRRASSH